MTEPTMHQVDDIPDSGLADSGLRHVFASGAQREKAPGKGRFDLLSPLANARLAEHMERGAIKYFPRNWEQGLPLSDFIDSADRHIGQILLGDESEPHAVAALWNLHCFVHTQEMIKLGLLPEELDDLPKFLQQTPVEEGESLIDALSRPDATHVHMPIPLADLTGE